MHRSPDPQLDAVRCLPRPQAHSCRAQACVYRAINAKEAQAALDTFDEQWGEKYPMIAQSWRERWEYGHPSRALVNYCA
ncbi:MAG: transposase [Solirubrobacteraceae bacterium]